MQLVERPYETVTAIITGRQSLRVAVNLFKVACVITGQNGNLLKGDLLLGKFLFEGLT